MKSGTMALANVTLPDDYFKGYSDKNEMGVIVLGETQVLGGGKLSPHPKGVDVREAWAIVDLDATHWSKLLPHVDLYVVAPVIAACVRSTIDRFAQAGELEVRREVDRRSGMESAIRVMVQEIPGATLRAGLSRPQGG